MELIFFYINQTSSKFIEKKGFNFSANYNFYVEIKDGKYILKQKVCNSRLPEGFFDEQKCITNITAIVGENGTGKTTLLTKLSNSCRSVKDEAHSSEYNNFFMEEYEKEKNISIYLDESGLVCYHNIDNFKNETEVRACYLKQGSIELMDIMKNNKAFENISKICISNSIYALEGGISTNGGISKISLNINSLMTLKSIFYKQICKIEKTLAGGYYEIQDIVCNEKTVEEFQEILDVLYLQYITENRIDSIFVKNLNKTLKVKFHTVKKYIKKRYSGLQKEKEDKSTLKKCDDVMINGLFSEFDFNLFKTDIFFVIYINLLYELIAYSNIEKYDGEQKINSKKELKEYIIKIINKLQNKKDGHAKRFQEAMREIQEYEDVLNKCSMYECSLPVSDMAYISYKEVKYGRKEYEQFLTLIKKSVFERKHSFILKYIDIGGLDFASGERALLNFFSWMHLIPHFNYLTNNVNEELHDNVLLLIDEIDLYCHPLWQQKLLSYLIQEIKNQYSNKKVQIIFTTHSPIVLSDMPRSNVIFLKRENDQCSIDEKSRHGETFGANIYKLFNDAFFLGAEGQIGEFAKKKIQTIIDKIKPDKRESKMSPVLSKDEIHLLEQVIALVGERIIQGKLYEMLYKCKYNSLELREKKIKIYEEKIKQLQNGEDI